MTGLAPLLAALSRTTPARIIALGDSVAEGVWTTTPISATRWQALVQSGLRSRLGLAGSGGMYVPALFNSPLLTDETTRTGSTTEYTNLGDGLGFRTLGIDAGGSATWAARTCTSFRVWYTKTDFFPGQVDVKVDGATAGTINNAQASGRTSGFHADFTVTPGSRTVSLTSTVGQFLVDGVEFFNGDEATGVHVYDGASSGAASHLYLPAGTANIDNGHWKVAEAIRPHATIVALGINDWGWFSTAPDQFEANMRGIASRAIASAGGDPTTVILVKMYRPVIAGEDPAVWADLMSRLDRIAVDTPQVVTFDMQAHWPVLVPDGSTNAGLMVEATNPVHLTAAGNVAFAEALTDWLWAELEAANTYTSGPPPRTLDEVLAGSGPRLTRVDIITGPRAGETLPVVDGSITVDLAADVRRTGSMTVPGTNEWTPDGPTHTLDVRSRSELQVWQGVVGDDGVEHWWSQGVFLVAGSSVSDSAGGGRDVSVDLVDRSHRIKRAGIRRRWSADGTAYILASIAAVLAEVAPWATLDIDLTSDITFGTDAVIAEWGDDVWVRCRALARTMSRDLHVNRDGVVVATPIVDPLEAAPVPMLGMVARSLQVDAEDIVNVTGCAWEEARPDDAAENWQPKGGVVEWVDNQSSTSVAAYGVCTDSAGGDTSVVHTAAHAALAAQAHGITRLGLQQAASGSKVPDPRDDVGVPVDVDGTTHIVSRLGIDLAGRSATSVDMGASRPDIALMMAGLTKPAGEYRTTEIVTGLSPLRARSVTDPGGSEVSVQWTDALAGVEVGDPITVSHKGAGLRVGVALLVKKTVKDKHAGEKVGTVGGADVTVGGNTQLRVRASGGSYANFSGGDATITVPTPDTTLNWSYNSPGIATVAAGAAATSGLSPTAYDVGLRGAYNNLRDDLIALRSDVAYMDGRLVNLEANNT